MITVAFYKATLPGIPGIYNRLIRWKTDSPYSHCEFIFSDGISASASFADGGVRFKDIFYGDADHWDFIVVPDADEAKIRKWFTDHEGEKYDLMGNVHFVLHWIMHSLTRWFCSESLAEAYGIEKSFEYTPAALHAYFLELTSPK